MTHLQQDLNYYPHQVKKFGALVGIETEPSRVVT